MAAAYIVADLVCRACGTRSSVNVLTPLVSGGTTFWQTGESDPEFTWQNIRTWYPVLREPTAGEPVRLLEMWTCPACGSTEWAQITFADTVITGIEAVALDALTVSAAHAINEDVSQRYQQLTGEALFPDGNIHVEFRDRLLAALNNQVAGS